MKPVNAHESETEGLPLFCQGVNAPPESTSAREAVKVETIPYSNFTTSKAAAEEIAPHLGELEGMVLEAIKASADGLTCEQV